MLVFAFRRLLQAVPILLGVSLIVFGLVQLPPGQPSGNDASRRGAGCCDRQSESRVRLR